MNAQNATYKQFRGLAEKNILPIGKMFVLLQRSNSRYGIETVGESCRLFLYPIINNRQVNRLVVCGSSNARKDKHCSPGQHHKPYFFNVQKYNAMNTNTKTAGETAREQLTVGSYEERKNAMVQLLQNSGTAFMVYLDENCNIRTCGIAEDGYESMLLPMLDIATSKARRVAEEALL